MSAFAARAANGTGFLIKFCRDDGGRVPDICEREVLVSLLGELLQVSVVRAWVIRESAINIAELPEDSSLIRDKCVVMPLLDGATISDSGNVVRAYPQGIGNIFAFMHWLGDDDRGLVDVFLSDGELVLIDNGLCGPGRDETLRSVYPWRERAADEKAEKCHPKKPSLVAFVLRDLAIPERKLQEPTVIESIEAISDDAVVRLVAHAGLASWVADVLILRRRLLRASYLEWLWHAVHVCCGR